MEPVYVYRAAPVRVIDGDTYVMTVDLGFYVSARLTIRLNGVNCPELREVGGPEAKAFVEGVMAGAGQVLLRSYKDRQTFARWVADIWIDGTSLSDIIVNGGHGLLATLTTRLEI